MGRRAAIAGAVCVIALLPGLTERAGAQIGDTDQPQVPRSSNSGRTKAPAKPRATVHAAKKSIAVRAKAFVVALDGSGEFDSIRAALTAAPAGARILVKPGTYREGLMLEDAVTLIADGPADSVVIESPDSDGILIETTDPITVRGFTIRSIAGRNEGKFYGVDCQQGSPVFEDCDFTSDSLACVAIHETGTNPTLRRCRVRDGSAGGIFCFNNGKGVAEDCNVSGNTLANVEVKTGGSLTVRRTRIHDGEAGGVFVNETGGGLFEDCDIYRNLLGNVEVKDGSSPTFRRCKMREGKQVGLFANANSLGLFEDCEMFANTLAGIEIKSGANPTIRRCRIYDGKAGGIFVNALGTGVIEDCDVTGNAFAGIEITEAGDPIVRRTRVHQGQQGGVFVYSGGKGTIEDSDIVENTRAGIEIKEKGNPVVRRCRINGNGYQAVWIYDAGAGSFEYCDLTNNVKGAWSIAEDSNARRVGNKE